MDKNIGRRTPCGLLRHFLKVIKLTSAHMAIDRYHDPKPLPFWPWPNIFDCGYIYTKLAKTTIAIGITLFAWHIWTSQAAVGAGQDARALYIDAL